MKRVPPRSRPVFARILALVLMGIVAGGAALVAAAEMCTGGCGSETYYYHTDPVPKLNPFLSVALGDVDGDGDLDLVTGSYGWLNQVYLNDGKGAFTDSMQVLGSLSTRSIALGDVDGDGDLDLVEGNGDGESNRVYLNDGKGMFIGTRQALGTARTKSIALGDVDGDGDLDLVAGNYDQPNHVYLNNGKGIFTDSGQALGSFSTNSIALSDMDDDGDPDLVAGSSGQSNRVYLNDGTGVFTDLDPAPGQAMQESLPPPRPLSWTERTTESIRNWLQEE